MAHDGARWRTMAHDGHSTWNGTVVEIEGTLLKLEENGKQWVFNTACSSFERAHVNDTTSMDVSDFVVKLTSPNGTISDYRPGAGDPDDR